MKVAFQPIKPRTWQHRPKGYAIRLITGLGWGFTYRGNGWAGWHTEKKWFSPVGGWDKLVDRGWWTPPKSCFPHFKVHQDWLWACGGFLSCQCRKTWKAQAVDMLRTYSAMPSKPFKNSSPSAQLFLILERVWPSTWYTRPSLSYQEQQNIPFYILLQTQLRMDPCIELIAFLM